MTSFERRLRLRYSKAKSNDAFSVLDSFQPENDRSHPIGAARNGHPFFFHPGKVAPIEYVHQVPLNIRIGPIAEAWGTVMAVYQELLAQFETIALRGEPLLIVRGGWVIAI
jgi:hypothetical protein